MQNNVYHDISFTYITTQNIHIDQLVQSHNHLPDIQQTHTLSKSFIHSYDTFIYDHIWRTNNIYYNHNIQLYSSKIICTDDIKYMLCYYDTYMDYFWHTITSTLNDECYRYNCNYLVQ